MRRGAVTTSVAGQVSGNMSGEKRAAYYNAPANTTSNHDPFLNVTADNKVCLTHTAQNMISPSNIKSRLF